VLRRRLDPLPQRRALQATGLDEDHPLHRPAGKVHRPHVRPAQRLLGGPGAARTTTFLGERYHRIARRRGKAKAQVAVARSILVIIWYLLADPAARFTDLGYGYYQDRTDKDRKLRNHIRQIEALGFTSPLSRTLNPVYP
jgi:hypothetical protein